MAPTLTKNNVGAAVTFLIMILSRYESITFFDVINMMRSRIVYHEQCGTLFCYDYSVQAVKSIRTTSVYEAKPTPMLA